MKVFISAVSSTYNQTRELLLFISKSIPLEIISVDYNNFNQPLTSQILQAIQSCDFVIADISFESSHIYYEIGIAHGNDKPVVAISQTVNHGWISIAFNNVYLYDLSPSGLVNLSYRIEYLLTNDRLFNLLRPSNQHYIPSQFQNELSGSMEKFIYNGTSTNKQLQERLYYLLSDIPGFQVTYNPLEEESEYDMIIWNSRYDTELQSLGNPIPVEVKGWHILKQNDLHAIASKARLQGFKSFLLFTTSELTQKNEILKAQLTTQFGINIIIIDGSQLRRIDSAQDLYVLLKSEIRKLYFS